ncbi:hypothetical protein [Kistimonas asteriae]|uniref:hypothetical protein n=1 Tax=Kistimonas asteriae TaxID=517724 RepID=UPI001BAC8043|nr:hypothetical protein [Kistimonas asteriae]
MSVSLGLYSGFACAALDCDSISNGYRCTDVVGLENQDIVIQNEDVVGTGSVVFGEQEYCILSYTTSSLTSNPSEWSRLMFDVQVDGDSSNGEFVLQNGGSALPVNFQWRGGAPVSGGSVWESPGPNNLTSDQQGALSCNDDPYSQAWLRFEVSSDDLQSANPGTYTGSFNVDIGQDSAGYHGNVNFTVRLPRLIKISGLDDMVLTERNANNNRYRQEEPFCVFVTGGGDYRIRASGGPGQNDPFRLTQPGDAIQYRVRLSSNGNNNITVDPGDWVNANNGSSSLNCNGGTNTKVRIVVLDSWIANKPAGVYVGTLYLTVEPG